MTCLPSAQELICLRSGRSGRLDHTTTVRVANVKLIVFSSVVFPLPVPCVMWSLGLMADTSAKGLDGGDAQPPPPAPKTPRCSYLLPHRLALRGLELARQPQHAVHLVHIACHMGQDACNDARPKGPEKAWCTGRLAVCLLIITASPSDPLPPQWLLAQLNLVPADAGHCLTLSRPCASPRALKKSESFGSRVPSYREDVPESPVLV